MTDKIQELINAKIKECGRVKGSSNYLDDTAVYELMQQYASAEVDRLLDCFAGHKDTGWIMGFSVSKEYLWLNGRKNFLGKASLLKYVGFSDPEPTPELLAGEGEYL